MKVTVFGIGYVGLVQAAVLADVGHEVFCVDIDQHKIDRLNEGHIPIYEPGLEPLVKANHAAGRIHFTTDAKAGIEFSDVHFIAVGTPPDEDGSADLKYVLAVAHTIATHMSRETLVIDKSTVPVGTADKVATKIQDTLTARRATLGFHVVSNPEFLKEGSAVSDCLKPDRIVIGTDGNEYAKNIMRELYEPFNRSHERLIFMDTRSAELTKYAL